MEAGLKRRVDCRNEDSTLEANTESRAQTGRSPKRGLLKRIGDFLCTGIVPRKALHVGCSSIRISRSCVCCSQFCCF
ncbi:hypothetical protein LINGRAHAP2_LOCUS24885 [Linum grandiflorum]